MAENDDSACTGGLGSLLSYYPGGGETVEYTVWGGCFENQSCGPNTIFASTCDLAASSAWSNGDTYLRLYRKVDGGSWVHVAANDNTNACASQCGKASLIKYNVQTAAKYQFRVGCAGNSICNGVLAVYKEEWL